MNFRKPSDSPSLEATLVGQFSETGRLKLSLILPSHIVLVLVLEGRALTQLFSLLVSAGC